MIAPSTLIAIDVILLYTILGPLVLFGIYILFDSLNKTDESDITIQTQPVNKTDPALWQSKDIKIYMDQC